MTVVIIKKQVTLIVIILLMQLQVLLAELLVAQYLFHISLLLVLQ